MLDATKLFVEGLNNKIRVIQRRAYGLRDEEYLRLKILTCMLPIFQNDPHDYAKIGKRKDVEISPLRPCQNGLAAKIQG